jgi:UDP-N-acetylglucosamine:LPS N-acetylglucosamine transferase
LSDDGAAVLLDESEVGHRLGSTIAELRSDRTQLDDLGRRARDKGEMNRRGAIIDVIEEIAGA